MNEKLTVLANLGSGLAMLTAAVAWVVLGGSHAGLAICIGGSVGLAVFTLLAWQSIRHHSHGQARDEHGRFVPVKEKGKIVQWVLVDEKPGETAAKRREPTR